MVIHPQFDATTMANDVALLFLSNNAPSGIRPVWLDMGLHYSDLPAARSNFTIMGMGYTQDSGASPINQLVSTTMRIVDDDTCRDTVTSKFLKSSFCAQGDPFTFNGQQFRSGSCLGDSGGPALVTVQPQWDGTNGTYLATPVEAEYAGWVKCGWNSTANSTISSGCDTGGMVGTLVGVTSLAYSNLKLQGDAACRSPSTIYAFTRVANQVPWILQSIADYGEAHGLTMRLPVQGPLLRGVSDPKQPFPPRAPHPPPPQPTPPPPRPTPPPPPPMTVPALLSGIARDARGGFRVAVFNPGCGSQPMQGVTLRVATGTASTDFDLGAAVGVLGGGQVFVLCGALTMLQAEPSPACDVSLGLKFAPTAQSAVQLMLGGSSFDGVHLGAAAASAFARADQAYAMVRTHRVGASLQADPAGAADAAPKMWASTPSDIDCRPSGAAQCDVPFVAAASCHE